MKNLILIAKENFIILMNLVFKGKLLTLKNLMSTDMKTLSRLLKLTFLILVFNQISFGKQNLLNKSIYFEIAKFELHAENKASLD